MMMGHWDGVGRQLKVKCGATVLADEMGRVLDQHPTPAAPGGPKHTPAAGRTSTTACVAPRHGQDVVVDPAGNAFSVRVHLAQHLDLNQRVAKLEATVAGLQGQISTHQTLMHDLRRENFVTQGAFMAAQLCKADKGAIKSQRGKLDLVCKLLISAGIFEEGAGGGLCVRAQEQRRKPCAIQQVDAEIGNKAFLEEGLANVEEAIAQLETSAEAASVEAKRTAAVAADACSRSEKASAQCRRVDERYMQVDERCRQVEEWCTAAVKQGGHRLEECLEESGERIETNSTRIFHLAAEVEGLAKAIKGPPAAARMLSIDREETGNIFSVEVADLPLEQRRHRAIAAAASSPKPTTGKSRKEAGENCTSGTVRANKSPGEPQKLSTPKESEIHRVPCRPGVLGEPESFSRQVADTRTGFLAASLQQPAPPPARRRCHSAYTGRRVTVSSEIRDAPTTLIIGPMRPLEEGPEAEMSSWSRASSWPLLPNEAAAHQLHDARAGTDAGVGAENIALVRRAPSMPSLSLSRAHGVPPQRDLAKVGDAGVVPVMGSSPATAGAGCDGPLHRHTTAIGDRGDDSDSTGTQNRGDDISQDAHLRGDSFTHQAVGAGDTGNEDRQPPAPSQPLARMTANEVAEALSIAGVPRGKPRDTSMDASLDSLLHRVGSPGTRLACLGNPLLDLGGDDAPSSDGSSTTAEGLSGEDHLMVDLRI